MNPSVIVVSPTAQLLGLTVDAAGAALESGLRLVAAPTLIEGRVFTEILQPTALLVDAGFAEDGQRMLLAAASVAGTMPVVLGGEGELPPGFVARAPVDRDALGDWLCALEAEERSGPPEDDMLAVVRARYAASLGDKATSMVASAAAVLQGEADSEASEAARRIAHRLRGSAGSYGFPAFGEIAARIDAALLGGLVHPPAASLTRAIEILALWRDGADPLGAAWPRVRIRGGHALVGELAPLAHAQRLGVEVGDDGEGRWIAELVEVRGVRGDEGQPVDSDRPIVCIGDEEVWLAGSGDSFARSALGARLPGLLRDLLAKTSSTTT